MTKGQEVKEEKVAKRKRRTRAQEEGAQGRKTQRKSIQIGP